MINLPQQGRGRPFDPTLFLTHTVSTIICSTIFGDWFDYGNKKFVTLINLIEESSKLQCSPWTALYSFFLTLMDYILGPYQRIFKHFEELRTFVLERVEMHSVPRAQLPSRLHQCFPHQNKTGRR
ncbi:C-X-C motif chemokine 13 [Platysternon megacephalum]|uniref:C-X-C motif chemokine 13 n=1 Tax=Platysternon megacephalum TaxID=55544 RepID=A0A4D9E6U6_9SAUR|nr:C-X-C motif chemokine 13 [Platysternon megacephalum]